MNGDGTKRESKINLKDTFRALRYRNYRLFFGGQGISLIGTWIQAVAMSWLVYSLTHSALWLGLVAFVSQIATFILSPFAGVLADRWNKHRLIIATQILFMIQAFVLAALVLMHSIRVWEILALGIFAGLVGGFDIPTRQAFVVEMVENREDLGNAIALNSSLFNSARLVGPAVAGFLIAAVGEGMCFLINGLSYVAVIIALAAMNVKPRERHGTAAKSALGELDEGFRYTFGFHPIRAILLLLGLMSLVAMPYSVLMPIFVSKILGGGAKTLGFLTAANGAGALVGAIFLASRKSVLGLGRWITSAGTLFGVGLIAFGTSRVLWISLAILVVMGFAMITQMAACNTVLQTIIEDRMRGRVMSFYTMAFMGMAPFGSLIAGALANRIGAPYTVMAGGAVAIIGALAFALQLPKMRTLVRPIYCKRGIIPAIDCNVESSSEAMVSPE